MLRLMGAVLFSAALLTNPLLAASTPGSAKLTATFNDMASGSGSAHYALVWVTRADNTFVTTLWKQGPTSFSSSGWSQHCPTWNNQRAGSTALPAPPDGYTSATATNYTATNPSPPPLTTARASNPINITWNGKDASGNVVPDGNYKFWLEYAEAFGTHGTDTGGLTPNGLTFTKGPTSATVTPANQGTVGSPSGGFNFSGISIVWTPNLPTVFTSVRTEGTKVVMSGTGPANGTYAVLTSPNASAPASQWTSIVTNTFSAGGTFSYTNALNPSAPQCYRLRAP